MNRYHRVLTNGNLIVTIKYKQISDMSCRMVIKFLLPVYINRYPVTKEIFFDIIILMIFRLHLIPHLTEVLQNDRSSFILVICTDIRCLVE